MPTSPAALPNSPSQTASLTHASSQQDQIAAGLQACTGAARTPQCAQSTPTLSSSFAEHPHVSHPQGGPHRSWSAGVDKRSVDTWMGPEQFRMGVSTGAPPDYFDPNGQNWGFPTYSWEAMARDGYAWWKARLTGLAQYALAAPLPGQGRWLAGREWLLGSCPLTAAPMDTGQPGQAAPLTLVTNEPAQGQPVSICHHDVEGGEPTHLGWPTHRRICVLRRVGETGRAQHTSILETLMHRRPVGAGCRYFHAYRIDHILGFFRIWEIPGSCTAGLLGHFRPSVPIQLSELESRGIWDIKR